MSNHIPKGGYVDPNHPSPDGPNDASIIIYGYTPALALDILGIVLYAASLTIHSYLLFRHRLWSFSPLAFGLILEVVGYIFRSFSTTKDAYSVIYFVVQFFCIVTAPVFISASIYVCLSKLIRWAAADGRTMTGVLRPRPILWAFISSDIVCTLIQVIGAALVGSHEAHQEDPTVPAHILLAGLCLQSFSFTVYLILLATFRINVGRSAKDPFIFALTAASLLVFLRTIFRLAEAAQGVFGYLDVHEAFFGALEFTPVVLAIWILAVWYPGRWLGSRERKRGGLDVEPAEEQSVADQEKDIQGT